MFNFYLKLLGKIYQYTGLYLAKKYEDEYVRENFYKMYYDWMGKPDLDMSFEDYVNLNIGLWQSEYGFVRKVKFKKVGNDYVLL